jgi:hypothetical protein
MPPVAPTSVNATAGDRSATVTWLPPMEPLGSPPILTYEVRASPGAVSSVSGAASRGTVGSLTNGVPVTFAVRALNIAGPGPWSAESTAVTPSSQASVRLVSGSGQSTVPLQLFAAPLVFEVTDSMGAAVPAATVTFSADTGVVVNPASATTDTAGQVSVTVRASRLTGPTGVTATSSTGPSLTVQLSTTRPADGTLLPVTNLSASSTVTFSPRAFDLAQGNATGLAVARDGTLYLANQSCELLRISREGQVSRLSAAVPSGACSVTSGDGQPGPLARFEPITSLVLDEGRSRLYVRTDSTTSRRVRAVPLDGTSPVTTLAGALSTTAAPAPGFGDNGPGSQTSIAGAGGLALSRDGRFLFFADTGANRLRRLDLASSALTVTSASTACTVGTAGHGTLASTGSLATSIDNTVAFFAGGGTGTCTVGGASKLWATRAGNDRLVSTGTAILGADGQNAREQLVTPGAVLFDSASNLLYASDGATAAFRIDAATSVARRIAGGGATSAPGVGPAQSFAFFGLRNFGLDDDGTLYFLTGTATGGVRAIVGVDRAPVSTVTVAATSGAAQVVRATDRAAAFTATVQQAGQPVQNARLEWSSTQPAVAFGTATTLTSAQGTASTAPWMSRRPQALTVTARLVGLTGDTLGSASFPVTVSAPSSGLVSTLGNVVRDPSGQAVPGPAALAGSLGGDGLDTDAQGVFYASVQAAQAYIARIDLDGYATRINVPGGSAPALAWHRGRNRLLYALNPSGPLASATVWEWNPATDSSTLVGGGAGRSTLDGDGANATSAFIGASARVAEGPANTAFVWDGVNRRIRVIDFSTALIAAWPRFQMENNAPCGATDVFEWRTPAGGVPRRFIAFNAAGTAFLVAGVCGLTAGPGGTTTMGTIVPVIAEVPPTGAPRVWAYISGNVWPSDMLLEASGALLWFDTTTRRVNRIDPVTKAGVTVLGNGMMDTPDWSAPLTTGLNTPAALAPFPQGQFSVLTFSTLRVVW